MAEGESSDRVKSVKSLAIILPIHAAVTAFTWRDIARRTPEQVRGHKRFWHIFSGANTLGSLLYFTFTVGRTNSGSSANARAGRR